MQLIETERRGVEMALVKDLAERMGVPAQRLFEIIGVPRATANRKLAAAGLVSGSVGQGVLAIARLLGIANRIVANSTSPDARRFDTAMWLGRWLERPQPSLDGRTPAELVGTPTGMKVVAGVLAAIESGSYQ